MKRTTTTMMAMAALLFTNPVFAGFGGVDSSGSRVGSSFLSIECGTGMTCIRDGNMFKMTPAQTTGTSLLLSSTLGVAGDFAVNTNKFTVAASSGNTVAAGTVESDGDFSVATNKFNVTAASGNTAIAGTLNSVGNLSVATNKFTVAAASGNTVAAGTVESDGDFSVATNKFNVTAASGNTAIAGTANVVGNFSVATNKFTVAAASGNSVVAGTLGVTGVTTPTGGIAPYSATAVFSNFGSDWKAGTFAGNTSATPGNTTVYLTQVRIPYNVTLTGVNVTNAATCGTNKWIVALFNSAGVAVANSALAGTLCSGASGYQAIPFTGTYAAVGPGTYWIGLYADGATDRYYAIPAVGKIGGLAGSVGTQVFGTVATVALPTTFTADVGPAAFTY